MKCSVPEISWHNRDPVLSIDVHLALRSSNRYKLATGGNDSHVVVWQVTVEDGETSVEALADLTHHLKPVNAIRFAPIDDILLASADDDGHIIVWRRQSQPDIMHESMEGDRFREHYAIAKTLRGHLQDVYDLCWSQDASCLISGAVDNTAIVWDVQKGVKLHILSSHDSFVQGVAWDPLNQLVATLSCDRFCRIFSVQSGKCISKIHKMKVPCKNTDGTTEEKMCRLFHDDTLQTFCRRLSFSPDGTLLLVPAGLLEQDAAGRPTNVVHVFSRHDFSRPVFCLPSGDKYTIAVRCCPTLFKLRMRGTPDPSRPLWEQTHNMLKLPYRMVMAVATRCSVLLYDTQQQLPFATISNIHFTRLTDLSWSRDGRLLLVSSTDGFCSIVTFEAGELGDEYVRPAAGDTAQSGQQERPAPAADVKVTAVAPVAGVKGTAVAPATDVKVTAATSATDVKVTAATPAADAKVTAVTPATDVNTTSAVPDDHDVQMVSVPSGDEMTSALSAGDVQMTRIPPAEDVKATSIPPSGSTDPERPVAESDKPRTPAKARRVALITLSSPRRPAVQKPAGDSGEPEPPAAETPAETSPAHSDSDAGSGSDQLVLHLEETTRELDEVAIAPCAASAPPPPPSPRTPRRVPLLTLSSPKRRVTPVKADP